MGVKVKIEKKKPEITFEVEDFRFAGQAGSKRGAILTTIGVFLAPSVILVFLQKPATMGVAGFLLLWLAFSSLLMIKKTPSKQKRTLVEQGLKIKVLPTNYPELKTMVDEMCKRLQIEEPEAFVPEASIGRITVAGGTPPFYLTVTTHTTQILTPEEIRCAIANQLAHIRCGHVPLFTLFRNMRQAESITRLVALPMTILTHALQNWVNLAELTGDRLTLLVIRNPRLCIGTLLKLAIENDPEMPLDTFQVNEFMKIKDATSSRELATLYEIGTALQKRNPFINERIQALIDFAKSKEYQQLIAKMDAAQKT